MEEKKTTKVLVWLIIILIVVVMGLVCYIIIDKNNSKSNNSPHETTKVEETITKNSYQLFAKNLKSQFSKYDSNNYNEMDVKSMFGYRYRVHLTENQTLYVEYLNDELKNKYGKYKIADNVLSFYVILTGQGGGNVLYFINEDGTVGSADTEYGIDDGEITIKKDLGYKNIVSIVSGIFGNEYSGTHDPVFIDINGNIFSESLK